MIYKIFALLIAAVFYVIYFGKMMVQRKKGIKTDQIASEKIYNKEFYIEFVMKIATISVVIVEIISILMNWSLLPQAVRITGICIGIMGDVVFGISVWTMRDSWRAGLARKDKTEMVTKGIYGISRNPAFVGFDLVYIGILLIFFNPILFLFSIFAMVMLHLQILQEEAYLPEVFGEAYAEYKKTVGRYLGLKNVIIFLILLLLIIGIIFALV